MHTRTTWVAGDCKIGALLSSTVLGMCYVISLFHDYHARAGETVAEVARKQINQEVRTRVRVLVGGYMCARRRVRVYACTRVRVYVCS